MHATPIREELLRDVDLLCLDAGNTIVFFDAHAAADAARVAGFALEPEALLAADAEVKRRLELGPEALAPALSDRSIALGWGIAVRTMVELAGGLDRAASEACVRALWRAHRDFNLWRRIPEGLIESLRQLRSAGTPVCVVSNSEGRLNVLFEQLGIAGEFDLALDSAVLGIEKPDPGIFRHALDHFRVAPDRALHLGDVVATDIVGARAAGIRAALIDPFGTYTDRHAEIPRVPGAAEVCRALVAARRARA